MTEVTRVPLQPIAKGSLTKLWLGVLAAILLAGGMAWASVPGGVDVETLAEGKGDQAKMGDVVFIKYVGKLADGKEFDRSQKSPFPPGIFPDGVPMLLEEGQLIPGFLEGLQQAREGGKYRIEIPAEQAYGASPPEGSPIPPNSDLTFEVEVMGIMSREEAERRISALQQMMQMQQGGSDGADGAPVPAPAPPSAPTE